MIYKNEDIITFIVQAVNYQAVHSRDLLHMPPKMPSTQHGSKYYIFQYIIVLLPSDFMLNNNIFLMLNFSKMKTYSSSSFSYYYFFLTQYVNCTRKITIQNYMCDHVCDLCLYVNLNVNMYFEAF